MVRERENVSFRLAVSFKVVLLHFLLADYLHGVEASRINLLDEEDFSKASDSKKPNCLKVFEGYWFLLLEVEAARGLRGGSFVKEGGGEVCTHEGSLLYFSRAVHHFVLDLSFWWPLCL